MAKLKHADAIGNMALSRYDESAADRAARPAQPTAAMDEVVENTGEWLDMTEAQAACGRQGHWEGELDWWERTEGDELVWSRKAFKGVCAICGAKRREVQ